MQTIFLYGMIMDQSLLIEKGLKPVVTGPAVLPGYRIHIGARATLVRSPDHRSYGMVVQLSDHDAQALYAEPSVQAYVPESIHVKLLATGEVAEVSCYNLPPEMGLAGANPAYASRLALLVGKLGFEAAYVAEVAAFAEVR
ncbi:MAG: gamma-glutamylcyclotransferase family protein [Saprospiraceae bacterium]|nr:gamma-glutamylcyclotransferase family protein [Saprospiraceae bacterium]